MTAVGSSDAKAAEPLDATEARRSRAPPAGRSAARALGSPAAWPRAAMESWRGPTGGSKEAASTDAKAGALRAATAVERTDARAVASRAATAGVSTAATARCRRFDRPRCRSPCRRTTGAASRHPDQPTPRRTPVRRSAVGRAGRRSPASLAASERGGDPTSGWWTTGAGGTNGRTRRTPRLRDAALVRQRPPVRNTHQAWGRRWIDTRPRKPAERAKTNLRRERPGLHSGIATGAAKVLRPRVDPTLTGREGGDDARRPQRKTPPGLSRAGCRGQAGAGFEPANHGFAIRSLRPLGYPATASSDAAIARAPHLGRPLRQRQTKPSQKS